MSEKHVAGDSQHVFRMLMGLIVGIVLVGIFLLITVVIVYRNNPGRHFPFFETTPGVSSPHPTPS